MPVLVLFFQENGLSLKEVLVLQGAFALGIVICEVPSGYFADLIGRKISLVWGAVLGLLGVGIFCFAHSFSSFLIGEILLAIGSSFMSGADSALLYDSLAALNRVPEYSRSEGRMQLVCNLSEAAAAVVGGLLATVSLRWPLYVEFATSLAGIVVAMLIYEPPRAILDVSSGRLRALIGIIRTTLWEHRALKWTMLHSVTLGVASFVLVWFIQPYLSQNGFPLSLFGLLWAALNAVVALGAWCAAAAERRISRIPLIASFSVLTCIAFGTLALSTGWWGLLSIAVIYFVRGVRTPIFKNYINRLCAAGERATVLSLNALMFRLGFALLSPGLGAIADHYSLSVLFAVCGAGFALALGITHAKMMYWESHAHLLDPQ